MKPLNPICAMVLAMFAFVAPLHADISPARALVSQAMAAMGNGHDLHRIAAIRSSAISASHDIVEFDHADPPYFFVGASRVLVTDDIQHDRRLTEETAFDASDATPSRTTRTLLSGRTQQTDIASTGRPTVTVRQEAPPSWQTDEPIRVLLLAEHASDLTQESDATLHGIPQHVLRFHQGGFPVRLFLDADTLLPSAIETTLALHRATSGDVAWNAWGDLLDRTELMNYSLVDGVRYPMQSDLLRNGVLMRSAVRGETHIDIAAPADHVFTMADAGTPAPAPLYADDLTLGQPIAGAPDPKKTIAEIAPGIVQIPNSWYSTIVCQDDGLVIIDAPISAGYSKRVLDEAARRFPGMPVKAVIVSTAFYWHMAGVREYAARGIPIYTRDRNVAVLRALLAAPHKLLPDDLARAPRAFDIHPISAPTTIGHGTNALVVMPVREGEQPMLMTWIASARLLHTAEMVQPFGPHGGLLYPESLLELAHSVDTAKIPTADLRMIGMHMSPTPWTELTKVLTAAND